MNADTRRLHRAMAAGLLVVLAAMSQAAIAGPATPVGPDSPSPSARPPPLVAKTPPPRCLKRSALGKCERRAPPTAGRNPPDVPASTH